MLIVTTPPAAEPVSAAELKACLRVTFDAEDDLISALIPAARGRIEAELGLALAPAGFRETFGPGEGPVALARSPLVTVDAVSAGDGQGGWTALDASAYTVWGAERPPRVARRGLAPAALRIDYTAGFAACPEPLRQAVLVLAAESYERRGDPAPTLAAAEPWLAAFRRGRL